LLHAIDTSAMIRAPCGRLVMRFAWVILCSVILFSACSPIYYAPNTLNVPMLREQGQGNAAVHFGSQESKTYYNVQGAYSFKPNWAFMGDIVWANYEDGSNSSTNGHGHLISGGAGYYRPFGKHFTWDAYGIAGLGRVENNRGSQGNIDSSLFRYGIQPSAGFNTKYFAGSFAARMVGLRYFNTDGSFTSEVQYLRSAGTQFLFEPAVTFRVGPEPFRFQLQVGHSHNLTDSTFKQESDLASIGFVYTFRKKVETND
jgi:hypothetical protein